MPCIFCKIANKEIPSHIVYEDDHFLAFLDISPVSKGHTLLIPKLHSDNVLAMNDDLLAEMMPLAKRIGNHLMSKLSAKGMNFLINTNEIAGQTCFHTHLHLIPRYDDLDGFDLTFKEDGHGSSDLKALAQKIKIG